MLIRSIEISKKATQRKKIFINVWLNNETKIKKILALSLLLALKMRLRKSCSKLVILTITKKTYYLRDYSEPEKIY